jgi:anti-sigma regulatory factor (Ser/Thr protein kinase)
MYRALSAWREGRRIEILVYFNQAAHTPTVDSLQQLQEVLAFQRNLQNLGFFVGSYDGPADFEAKIRQSLTQVVRRWPARPATATGAPPKSPLASPASRAIEHWHEELVTDRLDTVLDPRRGREFYTLAAVVRQALQEKGFRHRTVESASIALIELLSNAARHADSRAWLQIEIQHAYLRSIGIRVADTGPHFWLGDVIPREIEEFEAEGREHGLLLVRRLSGDQWSHEESELGGTHEVGCAIYETPPPAPLPSAPDFVGYLQYRDDFPCETWLGPAHFMGTALDFIMHAASSGSPRWRDLLFGPLLASDPAVIVADFTGHSEATIWRLRHRDLIALAERCLPERLSARQIVVLVRETSTTIHSDAKEWAERHGLPFFTDASACADHLERAYRPRPPRA